MARRQGQVNDSGKVEAKKVSLRGGNGKQEIPWTPGPKNGWEKFKRDAWG